MFSALPQLSESLIRFEFYFLGTVAVPFLWTLGKDSREKTFLLFYAFFLFLTSTLLWTFIFVNAGFLTLIFKYVHMVCQRCPGQCRLPDFFLQKEHNHISQSSHCCLLINPFLSPRDDVLILGCHTTLNIKAVSFSVPEELLIPHPCQSHHQHKPQIRVY